jgi:hypothetical protein
MRHAPPVTEFVMTLYFFDTRDNDRFDVDDIGVELSDIAAVKLVAARGLAELALDVLPGSMKRTLSVEVRDEEKSVMNAVVVFEAVLL